MKICILSDGIPPEGKGGAERIAWDSAVALQRAGHEVTVITTTQVGGGDGGRSRAPQARAAESTTDGIRVFSISSSYHVRWRAWRAVYNPGPVQEVRRLLVEIHPDIVHAHNVHAYLSYAALRAASQTGARVFHTVHDAMPFHYGKLVPKLSKNPTDSELPSTSTSTLQVWNYRVSGWQQFMEYRWRYNPFRNFFIRRALRTPDGLFVVSEALREALDQNGIHHAHVLYNGINSSVWQVSEKAVADFVHSRGLEGKKIVLFGGRITGTKGGDALLAAFPSIVEKVPNAVLLIMGTENEYVTSLKKRARESGIADHVICTGWISGDELRAAYHAATVVAVPSVYLDPLPTVVLEAMACEKPVVGSCLGGIPEMVEDGVTGYVVDPLDTRVLAARLAALLSDEQLAQEFGHAGAARLHAQFSEELHIKNLLTWYTRHTDTHD
jgi:glycosyltransferase involved in cell wall biosynthesis